MAFLSLWVNKSAFDNYMEWAAWNCVIYLCYIVWIIQKLTWLLWRNKPLCDKYVLGLVNSLPRINNRVLYHRSYRLAEMELKSGMAEENSGLFDK